MRKHVFGRKLQRTSNQRKALFKGLLSSLILYERIQTTESKAKAIKGYADTLVTTVKKNAEASKNQLQRFITVPAFEKLVKEIAPRFTERSSGYTRIIKVAPRLSDNASMVVMEWVKRKKEEGSMNQELRKASEQATEKREEKTEDRRVMKSSAAPESKKLIKKKKVGEKKKTVKSTKKEQEHL